MGAKRRAATAQTEQQSRPSKKPKPASFETSKTKQSLIFEPRPDWHTADLPPVDRHEVKTAPPQYVVDALHKHAQSLLDAENAAYNASHMSGSSSHKFMATIMASGTLEDKVSALTLLVQESPLHTIKAFENLVGMCKKKSRSQALMALAALKDLLGQGVVLPADRKLRAFGKQPALWAALQGPSGRWKEGEPLPLGLQKIHLVVWAYEDWLKRTYFELLQILENWCSDEVEYARSRAITYVWELLKDKPEQEENLLRLLVNKLGDNDRKIASRASYLLLQLENTHPAMKLIITNSIESDCLFRPGQSLNAKYYAIITLNQTILFQKDDGLANRLLEIYFGLFVQFLKPRENERAAGSTSAKKNDPNNRQRGGGKAGKMAAKKQKALERSADAELQLHEKVIAQVLTGVNRAFPFADTNTASFEKQMDTIFRVAHSSNFNTSIQALMLIQQISTSKHYGAERFYRTLYESLHDPRLINSSKHIMYLNLLYKALKADLNAKRVQAFAKRLLQILTLHEAPFICGVVYLISELETTFPSIRKMMTDAEYDEEDEEEHFVDVPEGESTTTVAAREAPKIENNRYDPRKRDPEHAHAERSCLWDLLPFLRHFHPSVSLFTERLLLHKAMPPKPDPTQHSLMHFLDRFVYRNAKAKPDTAHGASIMQPMAGSNAADLLIKPTDGTRGGAPVNSESFWQKKVQDVAVEDVFFHSYFNQIGSNKRKSQSKDVTEDQYSADSDDDDAGEDEIWEAIAKSKPEVEGPDSDDDDISLGDLESAYSASDDGSEPGLDLGGGEDGVDEEMAGFDDSLLLDDEDDDENDDVDGKLPDLESGEEDAFLDDDDDVPVEFELEEASSKSKTSKKNDGDKKQNKKKKLKNLPTFASADDYAKLLADEPEDY